MALPFTWAQTIYARELRKPLIDEISLSSVLLNRLMSKAKGIGGSGIEFPVRYAYNYNIGTITPHGSYDYVVPSRASKGYEDFVPLEQMLAYSGLEHDRNMSTAENLKAVDDILEQVEQAKITMRHYMAQSVYGDGTAYIVDASTNRTIDPFPGLLHILSTSNTVHGISQTDYPWFRVGRSAAGSATWATFVSSSTAATYVQILLQSAIGDATVNGEGPDLIVTTSVIRDAIEYTMLSNQRWVDVDNRAGIGWNALLYRDIPIVVDDECPSGYIFVLNTNHLYLGYNKNAWFKMKDWLRDPHGDSYLSGILADCCLICDSPRHQAIITTCPTARP